MSAARRGKKVVVIGAGPRGLSIVERLCANASEVAPGDRITVHVVDPYAPGAGRVWRTDQPRELLMNTVASQVTIFTDATVESSGPVVEGPSLYEWAQTLVPLDTGGLFAAAVHEEARRLGPDTYPSRAFYGHYLRWAYDRVVSTAPAGVEVIGKQATAVSVDDEPDGRQTVTLDTGEILGGLDAVVMAQGHLDVDETEAERELARHARAGGAVYIPPANPADTDLTRVRPGETVALRGLGLNFFDYMALLTLGRGGRFEPHEGELVYRPSGDEPLMITGSRRGIPYHARGENQKGVSERHVPLFLTPEVIRDLRRRVDSGQEVDFRRHVWPLVDREVQGAYYAALLERDHGPGARADFLARYAALDPGTGSFDSLLDHFAVERFDRWSWERIDRPHGRRAFADLGDFNDWLLAYLRDDVAHAAQGNVQNPLKAALDVMRDLRNEIRLVVDHGGISGTSYRADLDQWYTPMNAFLSIGPPLRRIHEMIALIEAGVLVVLGPGMRVRADAHSGAFQVSSDLAREPLTASAVIEARLPEGDLRTTRDPLLSSLLASGGCRTYRIADPDGSGYLTGGLAVTPRPYHVVDAAGRPHPRRFAYGIPTEHVHWVTAAGVRPGVNSVILGDSDAIARAALAAAQEPALALDTGPDRS